MAIVGWQLGIVTFPWGIIATGLAAILPAVVVYEIFSRPPRTRTLDVDEEQQSIETSNGVRVRNRTQTRKLGIENLWTTYDMFTHGMKISGDDADCIGARLSHFFKYFTWMTYGEVRTCARDFGSGLRKLGIKPGQDTKIGIYMKNSSYWVLSEQMASMNSIITVPLYDTLGVAAMEHVIGETEMQVIVTDDEDKAKKLSGMVKVLSSVAVLVYAPVDNSKWVFCLYWRCFHPRFPTEPYPPN